MENNDVPPVSAEEARSALEEMEAAQRSVRDTPWPTWLYPVNALLLGSYALAALLEDWWRLAAWAGIAVVTVALNFFVGIRMGTPWIVPTSRGFLICLLLAVACMVTALLVDPSRTAVVVSLAIAATILYLRGSVLHHRSTHR